MTYDPKAIADNVLAALRIALQERGIELDRIKHVPAFDFALRQTLDGQMDANKFLGICDKLMIVNPQYAYKKPAPVVSISVGEITTNGAK